MEGEYKFTIDGSYSPANLPMERLALYMAALAKLLGEPAGVHFKDVLPGSAVLVTRIDDHAQPKVYQRAAGLRDGSAPKDAEDAFTDLDNLLAKDNATGELRESGGAVIVPFPGKTRPASLVFGPFRQDGTLDGQVIRVGGRDDTIPVNLRDGDVVHTGLSTTADIARRLAAHYLGPVVRVHGTGSWTRDAHGAWHLEKFKITDFEVLDDTPLPDIVRALHRVSGSKWGDIPDPLADLLAERGSATH